MKRVQDATNNVEDLEDDKDWIHQDVAFLLDIIAEEAVQKGK